ncbi:MULTISPECIES: DUF262 domain-containing protein [Bacillus]|uniref:DUF262 domain-containing protein n=1 Tax=Bacillus TaxID=1386 RepID=UPI000BFBD04B|nr:MULTISPECIES: DUF262 domain-containing protein [Bacillus]MCR6850064.1 DUF262 domain-containing protein [Bacillus sp. IBL03825]PGK38695.1 hypothetical protein CN908_17175 [Bacillus thuringiensis]
MVNINKEFDIEWDINDSQLEDDEEDLFEDDDEKSDEKPFDADRIRVDVKPISVHQMSQMIETKDGGQINLNPDFQRRKVWKERKRKSLLIESLMLRIPIPVFYVYEDEESVWHVVDGLQRMNTMYDFIKGKFALTGLQYLTNNNGKKFSELDQKYKNRINTTTLTINVIDSLTPPQVKYDIFRRINTGGVPLNSQEIRNSTANKTTREFFKSLVALESFQLASNSINDLRMQAQELILRFIAFYLNYNIDTEEIFYKKGMDGFLDKTYEVINKLPNKELVKLKNNFDNAMKNAHLLFDKYAFRRITYKELDNANEPKLKPINKSLFTCTSIILAYYDYEVIKVLNVNDAMLKRLALEISTNKEFDESLSKGTGDVARIKTQFSTMKKIISEVIENAR